MLDVLSEPLYRGKYARAAALACVAVTASLAALAASGFIWSLLALGDDPLPPPAPLPAEQLAAQAEARTGAAVGQWHLFGNALPSRDGRVAVSAAPDTGLDLVLRGVFAGDDPKDGRAIIGDRDGNDRSFSTGATIVDGVVLDGIYPDRVMLARNGQLEALRLPRADSAVAAQPPRGSNTRMAQQTFPTPGVPGKSPLPNAAPANGVGAEPFVNPVISMGTTDYQRATTALGMDPAELAKQVSVLPVLEGGKFVGVRLAAGRDVPAIAKLGLEPDDIVTMVNGIALDSPARASEVAASLANASSVTVTVRRNGRTQNLSVSLR
jgi:general secretion pathway protein C